MTNFTKRLTDNWQDGLSLILGVWLVASPWVLGFAMLQGATWNAVIFGLIVALMALAVLIEFHEWEEWADMAIGAWLAVSPWVLGFTMEAGGAEAGSSVATANFVIVGLLVLGMAMWSLIGHRGRAHA